MTKAQNSPRGLFKKANAEFTAATLTTATLTSIVLGAGATAVGSAVSGIVTLTSVATKPSADRGVAFCLISNSTGVAMAVNSTGTTWKYLLTTSIQPT